MSKHYFFEKFGKFKFKETGNGYRLSLNFQPLGAKLDEAQMALDTQVWDDVKKYMPRDTGNFIGQTNALNQVMLGNGRVYLYPPESPYGHYLYEGVLYVDPVYGKGAFYSPKYGFWSRPDVEKVASDRKLTYQNPEATAHWGETAIRNHKDDWIEVVKRALR